MAAQAYHAVDPWIAVGRELVDDGVLVWGVVVEARVPPSIRPRVGHDWNGGGSASREIGGLLVRDRLVVGVWVCLRARGVKLVGEAPDEEELATLWLVVRRPREVEDKW